jgi:hypothetical protein
MKAMFRAVVMVAIVIVVGMTGGVASAADDGPPYGNIWDSVLRPCVIIEFCNLDDLKIQDPPKPLIQGPAEETDANVRDHGTASADRR